MSSTVSFASRRATRRLIRSLPSLIAPGIKHFDLAVRGPDDVGVVPLLYPTKAEAGAVVVVGETEINDGSPAVKDSAFKISIERHLHPRHPR